jgi:hypothetical protein
MKKRMGRLVAIEWVTAILALITVLMMLLFNDTTIRDVLFWLIPPHP